MPLSVNSIYREIAISMTLAPFDRRLTTSFQTASRVSSLITLLIGVLVLLGWLLDIQLLKSVTPGWVSMKPNAALGFVFSGLALYLLQSSYRFKQPTIRLCALVVGFLGTITLAQYLFHWNLGLDQWLFRDSTTSISTSNPGRMSPVSALNFGFIGVALWVSLPGQAHYHLMQLLALGTALTSLQVLIGYLYDVQPLFGLASFTYTAAHTALTFLIVSIGLLFAHPTRGWFQLVSRNTAGGLTARILLPAAIAVPLGLGWWRVWGEKAGWFDNAFGLSFHVIGNILAFLGLIWYNARLLNHLDNRRQQAEASLRTTYDEMEQRVVERTAELVKANFTLAREIEERSRVEMALRQSEERFRRAILDAPLPTILHAAGGEILQVNHAWTELTGYSQPDIPTITDWTAKAYGDRQQDMQSRIDQLYHLNQRLALGEHEIITRSGKTRIWDYYSAPLGKLPDGRSLVITMTIDVTERKQAEAERDQFFTVSLDMLSIAGVDGYFKQLNPAWEKTLGYTAAELMAEPFINFVHPEDQAKTSAEAAEHAAGDPSPRFENRYRCKDGSYKWLSWVSVANPEKGLLYAAARDITARKQTEHQLEQQAELLQQQAHLLELTSEAIIVRNERGAITYWNRGAELMYGWQREAALGQVTHTFLQTQTPIPGIDLDQVVLDQENWHGELTHRRQDNQEIIVESRQVVIRNPQGKPIGFLEVNRDISDRKRIEQEQQMLAAFVENSPDFIGTANTNGRILYINPAGRKLLGLEPEATINQLQVQDIHPASSYNFVVRQVLPAMLATGIWEGENWLRHCSTGEAIPVHQIGFVNRDPKTGAPLSLATVIRDMRERQRAEAALRESEERFRSTFNQAAVGIAHVALDGRWLRVNQKLCAIVGYSYDELLQKTFQDITYRDDLERDLTQVERLLRSEIQYYTMDKRYLRKDGSLVWINLTGSLVRHPDGTPDYFISVIQDISERVQLEAERQAAAAEIRQLNETLEQRVDERTAQLAEVNQELKRFAYSVSHDLRSPLRAMRGLIAALVEDYGDCLDALGQEYAHHIADSARRMDTLIQDLLTYSRLSQSEIQLQTVDLNTVVADVVPQLRTEQEAKQATITIEFPLPVVVGQTTIVHQVLLNLLGNALKYTDPEVPPEVRVWAETRRTWARLWVTDNGIGIAPEDQGQIFGVFERLYSAGNYPGTGIGLAIVQRGIERLGGRVGVESAGAGQGSRFWIELPLLSDNSNVEAAID